MNIVRYPADRLTDLLRDQKVATMPQLKNALGTSVTFTVLRKLAPMGYRSSYSHGGTYYRGSPNSCESPICAASREVWPRSKRLNSAKSGKNACYDDSGVLEVRRGRR
jgi:hypothetical protein